MCTVCVSRKGRVMGGRGSKAAIWVKTQQPSNRPGPAPLMYQFYLIQLMMTNTLIEVRIGGKQ